MKPRWQRETTNIGDAADDPPLLFEDTGVVASNVELLLSTVVLLLSSVGVLLSAVVSSFSIAANPSLSWVQHRSRSGVERGEFAYKSHRILYNSLPQQHLVP